MTGQTSLRLVVTLFVIASMACDVSAVVDLTIPCHIVNAITGESLLPPRECAHGQCGAVNVTMSEFARPPADPAVVVSYCPGSRIADRFQCIDDLVSST